jgi:hypothetical protein
MPRRIVSVARHGVVGRLELLAMGVAPGTIDWLVQRGFLWSLFPGAYAVGRPEVSQHGRWRAAVLACGEGAVLSHQDAAALRQLGPRMSGPTHVTVPRVGTQRSRGLRIHVSRTLHPDDVQEVEGIPCTGAERTLLDLCDSARLRVVEQAAETAYRDKLLRVEHLHRQRSARGRRLRKLERALRVTPGRERSGRERRFVREVAAAGLAAPLVNVWFPEEQVELDAYWPEHGLAVEIDSAFHDTPHAQERDARKDAVMRRRGIELLRVRPPFGAFVATELRPRLAGG